MLPQKTDRSTIPPRSRPPLLRRAVVSAWADTQIPFQDVDPAMLVWHGNYFRYFALARSALMRKLDYDYPQMRASGYLWPLTDTRVRFIRALRYAQNIRIWAGLTEYENRMKIEYEIRDPDGGARIATGYTVHCAVTADEWELQLVSPAALRDRLQPYL